MYKLYTYTPITISRARFIYPNCIYAILYFQGQIRTCIRNVYMPITISRARFVHKNCIYAYRYFQGKIRIYKLYLRLSLFPGPYSFFLKKRGCPGWVANLGPLHFIYFLIFHHFTAEPQRLPIFLYSYI
jgi:hypothetical protein